MPPSVEAFTTTAWAAAQVFMPWLTGGLAGAVLTFTLGRWLARRQTPRLTIELKRQDYSIPARDENSKDFKVSYGGKSFDSLLRIELSISNDSGRTITKTPILLTFSEPSTLLNFSSVVSPIDRVTSWSKQDDSNTKYLWDSGELKPTDSTTLTLVLAPATKVSWAWRGDDEVRTFNSDGASPKEIEDDVRLIVMWLALYVLLGAFSFFGNIFQSLLILGTVPFAARASVRIGAALSRIRASNTGSVVVTTGEAARVDYAEDAKRGTRSLSVLPAKSE